ncbi:hypothetical protein PG985_005490 [Apiospora marii]|uniref:Uncharacterized protein n=1 Tax=Apiospora marii TaxID=335849 RepID=A0ABR1RKG8_9PEZI
MSEAQETDFRLPEEWEAQEILDKEVVGEKTYYLVGWKPTLVPETEVSTTLLQTWQDEMDNSVTPNRDSVLESPAILVTMPERLAPVTWTAGSRSRTLRTKTRVSSSVY